jgi:hypothetical protein
MLLMILNYACTAVKCVSGLAHPRPVPPVISIATTTISAFLNTSPTVSSRTLVQVQ